MIHIYTRFLTYKDMNSCSKTKRYE